MIRGEAGVHAERDKREAAESKDAENNTPGPLFGTDLLHSGKALIVAVVALGGDGIG